MSNTIPALQPARICDVALISSESSIMQGHHRSAHHAWLADDDITAFMAEPTTGRSKNSSPAASDHHRLEHDAARAYASAALVVLK